MPKTKQSFRRPGARSVAFEILLKGIRQGSYANLALDSALSSSGLSESDGALCARLVYGVIETQITLDYILNAYSANPVNTLDDDVRTALRMGLYQLRETDKIPAHAALNETVELVPVRKRGYVNAVLRQYLRNPEKPAFPDPVTAPLEALSVQTGIPLPLVTRFSDALGFETASALLSGQPHAPLTLRVNTLRTSRDDLIALLRTNHPDLTFEPTPISPAGILCSGGHPARLSGFSEGLFFVQDESSQICTCAAGLKPGMTVLDVCACPGSKSLGFAIDMADCGCVVARDLHANKLPLIQKSAARLGLSCIRTSPFDAQNTDPDWVRKADAVLCDVPCSGYGILFKKPEIRHKDPAATADLPALQLRILEASSAYVRSGGTLVYSTCTLLPEENESVIRAFLLHHPRFVLQDTSVGPLRIRGMQTLYPHIHHTDGFFFAVMKLEDSTNAI